MAVVRTEHAQTGTDGASASRGSAIGFEQALGLVSADLKSVEEALRKNYQSDVAYVPMISDYLVGGGGKRIRPMLLILASRMTGYRGQDRHITMSCVIEYIHAATLLHDDVVDEAATRRGRPAANTKWGNQASVLVGDYLYSKAFSLMTSLDDIAIVRSVSDATTILAEGEILQLVNTNNVDNTEEVYLDTVYRKTASLISASCRVGGQIGGVGKDRLEALTRFGRSIGMAFQLVDDILDYTSTEAKLGKPVCNDLIEGIVTMPFIHAMKSSNDAGRKILRDVVVADVNPSSEAIEAAVDIMRRAGSFEYSMTRAKNYVTEAKRTLSGAYDGVAEQESKYLEAMLSVADYIVSREL